MNELVIENLSKTYKNGVKALDKVNLRLENGMFGLLGPNGAGKSTLMRTLACLQEPSEGKLTFNGVDIVKQPEILRNQLGYLPQEFGVYPKLSAYQLLDHIAVLKGILNKKERKDQIEALLERTNLYHKRKNSVSTYSGGMRQRFGIAQALLGNPSLIIVDEPTAGLDPEERNRFLNLLSEIGENIIVILSTHIVEDVSDLCSNMAILADGKLISRGTPADLMTALDQKIWMRTIEKQALNQFKETFSVLSTRLNAGKIQIRVLANDQPESPFKMVNPDLEDVYFSALNTHQLQTHS